VADVIGAIREKWLALGGANRFGDALDIERPTFDGVGRAQGFAGGGVISWHPQIGAFAVWGEIRRKWEALGREQFGYPVTDESPCPDRRGRFNHFRAMQIPNHPDASIYWTPQTGPHEVHGAIRGKWASLGWERSSLGYPTQDEHDFRVQASDSGGRRSDFEHGWIYWTPRRGVKVYADTLIDSGTKLVPADG
jgi:uncharacterized protein with LGFP repeats